MTKEYFEFQGTKYDITHGKSDIVRHGGPFDRGSADSYYGRGCNPHYFIHGTHTSPCVDREQMTDEQIKQYYAGFEYNETVLMDRKEW